MLRELRRVAAVHDITGYGKCALTIAIPVLSAAGVEVCPLPTAVLSGNTVLPNFTFLDYSPYMQAHLDHWQSLGLRFDGVYSGFLGSVEQIHHVQRLIRDFSSGIAVVDPVMGDDGLLIPVYDRDMCRAMQELVASADYVTPNVTEACLLTGREYRDAALSPAESEEMCREIAELGCGNVVLTGVQREGRLCNCGWAKGEGYFERSIELLPFTQHGTGDLFTSTLTAGLIRGYSLVEAVDSAAAFVRLCMEEGQLLPDIFDRGVAFEPHLYHLRSGVYQE